MQDATATMGNILPNDIVGRDAVHVAVVSVEAAEKLSPGQDVGLEGEHQMALSKGVPLIGIVDPYLKTMVFPGQRFWLFLYPRTITSLKHQWTHPAFDDASGTYSPPSKKLASERWLRNFAMSSDCPPYEEMVALAVNGTDDDYLLVRGSDAHGDIPPEFWDHIENVTGRTIPAHRRASFFSCSC